MKTESAYTSEMYITVRAEGSGEVIIQKSRFIGYAAPCETEEEALAFLKSVRDKHRDARHHCYAYVIGLNSGIIRYSDDGEPGGTAGLPIMDVLKNAKAVNCCVVVVRYFGGILLGTGGLVRAYTEGCKIALQSAGLVRMELSEVFDCTLSYSLWNSIQYTLMKMPVQTVNVHYSEKVAFTLIIRKKDSAEVIQKLQNLSDGKMEYETVSEEFRSWDP